MLCHMGNVLVVTSTIAIWPAFWTVGLTWPAVRNTFFHDWLVSMALTMSVNRMERSISSKVCMIMSTTKLHGIPTQVWPRHPFCYRVLIASPAALPLTGCQLDPNAVYTGQIAVCVLGQVVEAYQDEFNNDI